MEKKEKNTNSKKKYIKLITPILLLGVITFGLVYFYAMMKSREQNIINGDIDKFDTTFPNIIYGTTLSYDEMMNHVNNGNDLSKSAVITLKVNDQVVKKDNTYEFLNVGENKIVVELSYPEFNFVSKKQFEFKFLFTVTENAEPYIANIQDFTIQVGEELDLTNYFVAYDSDGTKLQTQVAGNFDNMTIGSYDMTVSAIKNGEEIIKRDFKVVVKDPSEMMTTIPEGVTTPNTTNPTTEEIKHTTTTVKKTTTKTTTKKTTTKKTTTKFNCSTSKSKLTARGYKPDADKDACQKDEEASRIVKQIAEAILAKGYKTDIDKVQAAASKVSEYYYKGVHVESGYDYRTPYGVFIKGEASCAGCTRALIQVLEYMGFKCTHANPNAWTHQWVILTMDGKVGYADGQVGMVGYGCHPFAEDCQE